jgi:hypothetical protein
MKDWIIFLLHLIAGLFFLMAGCYGSKPPNANIGFEFLATISMAIACTVTATLYALGY